MDISRLVADGMITLTVAGRIDGSWADHLDGALSEAIRDGHHDVRLDLAAVVFLSSAGIGVLVKTYQRLTAIGGTFAVVNPSVAVERVLKLVRLAEALTNPAHRLGPSAMPEPQGPARCVRDGAAFDVHVLDAAATLSAEVIADDWPGSAGERAGRDVCLGGRSPVLAMAVGAFGAGFDECRDRYGEMLSIAGATACLPTDGSQTPDFLVSASGLPSDVRVLHGIVCEGRPSHLLRFEPVEAGRTIGLGGLLAACGDVTRADRAGVVIVAEAAGLVGASLRQSPAMVDAPTFFEHPGIRSRLTFTAEPAFARTLVVIAAVVATVDAAVGVRQLRPVGGGLAAHAHAAAFGFRLLKKGRLDLRSTVAAIFEEEPLAGVLHLLSDDREPPGAGESQFIRGACWTAPIVGDWRRS